MLFKPLLAFTLLGSVLASSVLPRNSPSVNPPVSVAQQHQQNTRRADAELAGRAPSPSPVVQMTNAERMVVGLPLMPPRRRGSRTSNAARAAPSAGAPSTHGYILARAAGTSTPVGYIKRDYNIFGENGLTSPDDINDALKVILPAEDERTGPFNFAAESPVQAGFPFLGFITGFANTCPDLGSGKFNYVYFGGVTESSAFSAPSAHPNTFTSATGINESTESAVWLYDDATGKLTPHWINTGGSIPDIYYGYYSPDQLLFATGDKGAFEAQFGANKVQWLDLYYVTGPV